MNNTLFECSPHSAKKAVVNSVVLIYHHNTHMNQSKRGRLGIE